MGVALSKTATPLTGCFLRRPVSGKPSGVVQVVAGGEAVVVTDHARKLRGRNARPPRTHRQAMSECAAAVRWNMMERMVRVSTRVWCRRGGRGGAAGGRWV